MLQLRIVLTKVSYLVSSFGIRVTHYSVLLPGIKGQGLTGVCLTSNVITIGKNAFLDSPLKSILLST